MASSPPRPVRRRPRRGSLERPINARSYRGTWLLVAIPPDRRVQRQEGSDAASSEPPAGIRHDRRPRPRRRAGRVDPEPQDRGRRGHAVPRHGSLPSSSRRVHADHRPLHLRHPREGRRPGRTSSRSSGRSPQAIVLMSHRDDTGVGPERTTTPRAPARCSSSRESTPALEPDRAPDAARARRTTSSSSPPMEALRSARCLSLRHAFPYRTVCWRSSTSTRSRARGRRRSSSPRCAALAPGHARCRRRLRG